MGYCISFGYCLWWLSCITTSLGDCSPKVDLKRCKFILLTHNSLKWSPSCQVASFKDKVFCLLAPLSPKKLLTWLDLGCYFNDYKKKILHRTLAHTFSLSLKGTHVISTHLLLKQPQTHKYYKLGEKKREVVDWLNSYEENSCHGEQVRRFPTENLRLKPSLGTSHFMNLNQDY